MIHLKNRVNITIAYSLKKTMHGITSVGTR